MFPHHEVFALFASTAALTGFFSPLLIRATDLSWWIVVPSAAVVSFFGTALLFTAWMNLRGRD